jgi:indolepyruvate ferredoxin oxidoreductase beta subunit
MIGRNFLVVGVGGQGALLASNILADVGVLAGYDVKKAEVHGMSQRGGSVNSHIRWAKKVWSPVIERGEVDILLALEKLETLRYLKMLRKNGYAFIGDYEIPPLTVSSGNDLYPEDIEIRNLIGELTDNFYFVPTLKLAKKVGTARAHNVVLLGAVSNCLSEIETELWFEVIRDKVPRKYHDMNHEAFLKGKYFGNMSDGS